MLLSFNFSVMITNGLGLDSRVAGPYATPDWCSVGIIRFADFILLAAFGDTSMISSRLQRRH